jgi:general secretion pathway protein F
MCRSNVPLPKALRLLSRDLQGGKLRRVADQMAGDVEVGMTLAQAYGRHQEQLPPLYRALIEAGTASGDLPGVLDEVARHAAEREEVKARVQRALLHPLISAFGVLGIGVGLFLFSVPVVSEVGDRAGASFAAIRSNARPIYWELAPWGLLLLLALTVCGILAFAWWRNPMDGGAGPKGFAFRLPFTGYLRSCAARSGFASTMGMLIQRRMPLPQALALAAAATDDPAVRRQVDAMAQRAQTGANLTDSVTAGDLISPSLLSFIESGESTGAPEKGLIDVARIYRQRVERGADRLCSLVGPVSLGAVGLVVLAFAATVFGPMYSSFIGAFF